MADKYERYTLEFPAEPDFDEHRNRIGGLLLLPRSFNRSYGDLPFEEKRRHYLQQNVLAQTFHEQAYDRNPRLRRLIDDHGLPFQSHSHFQKDDLELRQKFYVAIAERVWTLDRLEQEAQGCATV